jgi:energy-coupling factor transporter ATP-binding protein EcfA2
MPLQFGDIYVPENFNSEFAPLKDKIEHLVNLSRVVGNEKRYSILNNKLMRICLLVGLSTHGERDVDVVESIKLQRGNRMVPSFFTHQELSALYSALIKLRYHNTPLDLSNNNVLSRIIGAEMYRGRDYLLADNNLENYLFSAGSGKVALSKDIPVLNLLIGNYGDAEMEATLDINSRAITNSQIIIAGATGSGKTNLLAVLMQQIRSISSESRFPVNFLLFDYKGEFSDIQNNSWLTHFDVDRSCILDPIEKPLPFTPFKDFTGRSIQEINLYSTEMASALSSLDRVTASSNMSNRLAEAIVEAYKTTNGAPISFDMMLKEYQTRMKDADKDDSISSVLKQLVRANIFSPKDEASLIDDCYIVKMDGYPKDGPIAKAIVYFLMSKLNNIYEQLDKQAVNDEVVQIRHFSIIDEAHYMLSFDNRPLRNLIAVGRNKGLSIILATQNMSDFKNKGFDFYANAQYPLIMKQQTIDDKVIKDLYGVSGSELQDVRTAIAGLQKGELIIKDQMAFALGMGNKYKKINVTHLI